MRRLLVALLLVIGAAACGDGGGASAGPETRTVLVDFNHDELATTFLAYYPRNVAVRPGDTVVFEQQWTGESHTVTMGTRFDEIVASNPVVQRWVKEGGPFPTDEVGADERARIEQELDTLPRGVSENFRAIQPAARPCFLDAGLPPTHPDIPCPEDKREQVPFDGTQTYYSSGYIPYEGEGANRFSLPLAADIEPGDYAYYCTVHGLAQSGVVTVQPEGSDIPSQSRVDRQARREIEGEAGRLRQAYDDAQRGETEAVLGRDVDENLAGWQATPGPDVVGHLLEYIPRRIQARVGEKVTWRILGPHTVSFDVPEYVPVFTVDPETDAVTLNPQAVQPVGGPGPPPPDTIPPPPGSGRLPPDVEVDAGTWNGTGFLSSGLFFSPGNLLYGVTFTQPGTYKYACLIHPRMIGEIEIN